MVTDSSCPVDKSGNGSSNDAKTGIAAIMTEDKIHEELVDPTDVTVIFILSVLITLPSLALIRYLSILHMMPRAVKVLVN